MSRPLAVLALVLSAVVFLGACGSDDPAASPDAAAGGPADARIAAPDAPPVDAPLPDAPLPDAPPPDAPPPDAPLPPDAAPPIDAAETPDAAELPPDAAPGVGYRLTTAATEVPAGSTVTISAQFVDLFNHPVAGAGRPVTFTISNGGVFEKAIVTTDGTGQAVATLTFVGGLEGHEITVEDDRGAASVAPLFMITVLGPPSLERSTLEVFATSMQANGTSTADVRVRLLDLGGNPIIGDVGAVTVTATLGTMSPVSKSGVDYDTVFKVGTVTGTATIKAFINGMMLATTRSVTVVSVGGATEHYAVTSSSEAPLAGEVVTLSAQLLDNTTPIPAAGRVVTWDDRSLGGGSFATPTSTTNGSGKATVQFTCTTVAPRVHDLGATDGKGSTGRLGLLVMPGPASLSTSTVVADPTSVVAGQEATVITVTPRDGHGNPTASGAAITMATTFGTLSEVQTSGSNAFASLGAETVGEAVVSAKLGGSSLTHTAHVSFTVGGATHYILSLDDASPEVGQAVTLTAQLADSQNRPVTTAGLTVSWSETGSGMLDGVTSTTNATGKATMGYVVDTKPRGQTITAGDGTHDDGSLSFTGHPGPLTMIVKLSADNQNAAPGANVPDPPEVKAVDQFGNPLLVSLNVVVKGGGTVNGGATQLTLNTGAGGFGLLDSWTLGPAGDQSVEISGGGIEVVFTAFLTP